MKRSFIASVLAAVIMGLSPGLAGYQALAATVSAARVSAGVRPVSALQPLDLGPAISISPEAAPFLLERGLMPSSALEAAAAPAAAASHASGALAIRGRLESGVESIKKADESAVAQAVDAIYAEPGARAASAVAAPQGKPSAPSRSGLRRPGNPGSPGGPPGGPSSGPKGPKFPGARKVFTASLLGVALAALAYSRFQELGAGTLLAARVAVVASGLALAAPAARDALAKSRDAFATLKENLVWVRNFWKRIGKEGIDVKKPLIIAAVLNLVITSLSFVPPYLFGLMNQNLTKLAAAVSQAHALPWYRAPLEIPIMAFYLKLGGVALGVYALNGLLGYLFSRNMFRVGNTMMEGLNNLFIRHAMKLPLAWHNSRPVGDVISTATEATYNVQKTSTDIIVRVVKYGTMALGSLIGMLWVSWPMTLGVAPFLAIVLSVPSSVYGRRLSQAYKLFFAKAKPKLTSHIEQTMVNIAVVQASGKEDREIKNSAELSRQTYIEGGGVLAEVSAPYYALQGTMTEAAKVVVIMAAAMFLSYGMGLSIASATTYLFLSNYFRDAIQVLYDVYVNVRNMKGSAAKFDKIMDLVEQDYNEKGTILPESGRGRAIRFDGVTFGYKPGQEVLKNVSVDIKPGEMAAFVGPSGAGKTTMTWLALGLYPVQKGKITIDGVEIKDLNKKDFRGRTATILQDPNPFNASIAYNISYLKPEASETEIWDAAREAGLHDDVVRIGYDRNLERSQEEGDALERLLIAKVKEKIPQARRQLSGEAAPEAAIDHKKSIFENIVGETGASFDQAAAAAASAGLHDDIVRLGYATKVGERGVNISGGQKQRLSLARLFIDSRKFPDIMILDEPTAALDGMTQRRIQDAVEKRRGKSTVIVIAHRLSTIQNSDKIFVFNRGVIVEQGSHQDLLRKGGVYSKMWEVQRIEEEMAKESQP